MIILRIEKVGKKWKFFIPQCWICQFVILENILALYRKIKDVMEASTSYPEVALLGIPGRRNFYMYTSKINQEDSRGTCFCSNCTHMRVH